MIHLEGVQSQGIMIWLIANSVGVPLLDFLELAPLGFDLFSSFILAYYDPLDYLYLILDT